jgi:hypothetical protein
VALELLCGELNRQHLVVDTQQEAVKTVLDRLCLDILQYFGSADDIEQMLTSGSQRYGLRPNAAHMIWCRSPPSFVTLPQSYSALHARLTSSFDVENPAICMKCGAVLNADGSGQCTAHVRRCCGDSGIIFLVQVKLRCLSSL